MIFMPIFIPLLPHFNIDPLFFGLLVALNLQTAFLSPPVAMAAFYLKGVSPPHVTLNQIFAGMLPFMAIQVFALVLLYVFPASASGCPRSSTNSPFAIAFRRPARVTSRRRRGHLPSLPAEGGDMLVSEILRIKGNTLFTTTPEGSVLDAVKAMADNDIGSLVVMDHGRLAGMLTFREVIAALAKGRRFTG